MRWVRASAADRFAKALDPAADFFGAGLQRRAVDDQPGADLGNRLDLDQTVGLEGGAGLYEIDDVMAEPQTRRQLDRAVELDAFRLDPSRRKMPAGNFRVLRRDAHMARSSDVGLPERVRRRRDGEAAMPDIEVERRVDLRIVEFHQHVIAGDAELSGAEGDKGGGIEAAHADQIETRLAGC